MWWNIIWERLQFFSSQILILGVIALVLNVFYEILFRRLLGDVNNFTPSFSWEFLFKIAAGMAAIFYKCFLISV